MTLIPLSSQSDAKDAVIQAKENLKKEAGGQGGTTDNSDTSDDEEVQLENGGHTEDDEPRSVVSTSPTDPATVSLPADQENTSVAKDVIGRKGQYGRFAERWFSRKGWSTEKKRTQGMSADAIGKFQVDGGNDDNEKPGPTKSYTSAISQGVSGLLSSRKELADYSSDKYQSNPSNPNDVTVTLLPKLLRTTKMLFGSRSFFFSYDYDLTRRLGSQEVKSPEIPMHKIVDPLVSSQFTLSTILTRRRPGLSSYRSSSGTTI